MFNAIVGTGAVGAGAASHYGSGSDQKVRLLAAPAPQHCFNLTVTITDGAIFKPIWIHRWQQVQV
jgi:hypothetical protein